MEEEIRYQVLSESPVNNQSQEPAMTKVTFSRNIVKKLRITLLDGHILEEETQRSNQQFSIWIPAAADSSNTLKTLAHRTMTAMEIPECVHAEIIEEIDRVFSRDCTCIWIEVEMVMRLWMDFQISAVERMQDEAGGADPLNTEEGREMSPATRSSNEDLERLQLANDLTGDNPCAVCMEELEAGVQAIRLPCSHLYHQNCIVKWLHVNPSCPLCRHEIISSH